MSRRIYFFTFLLFTMTAPTTASAAITAVAKSRPAQISGQIVVHGEPGPSQKFALVKAVQCERPTVKLKNSSAIPSTLQRNCQAPVYFQLNQSQTLPVGEYLLGFENSMYPGFVEIQENTEINIDLAKIEIPAAFAHEKQVRVYRDFSSLIEQRKIYLSIYYTGAHFFRLTKYSFGDFYITGKLDRDYFQLRTFKPCSTLNSYENLRSHANFVCNSWNNAKSMMDMADLYRFEPINGPAEGTFQEALYFEPGDVQAIRHGKYLVSIPFDPAEGFVSVFPGVYRISVDEKNIQSIRVETQPVVESYPETDLTRELQVLAHTSDAAPEPQAAASQEAMSSSPSDVTPGSSDQCDTARMWRTENRSYCVSDKAEGCDRSLSAKCQPITFDVRFRK